MNEQQAWDRYHADVEPALTVALVYSGVKFTGRGPRLRSPCPLHGGDNPQALSVEVSTLRWTCHTGCKPDPGQSTAGGGPIEWVMRRDSVPREEARNRLAMLVGVDLHADQGPPEQLDQAGAERAWKGWCMRRRLDRETLERVWDCRPVVQPFTRRAKGKPDEVTLRPAVHYPVGGGVRVKYTDTGKPKYQWHSAGAMAWYGLHEALGQLRTGGIMWGCNGAPARWACHQAGVPALCLEYGEGTAPDAALVAEMLHHLQERRCSEYRLVQDSDKAGRMAAPVWVAALEPLSKAGIRVSVYALPASLPEGSDIGDLHQRVGDDGLLRALLSLREVPVGEPLVANFLAREDVRYELSQSEIVRSVHLATGGWPRAVNGLLFAAADPPAGALPDREIVRYLDGRGTDRLFAWIRSRARVEWAGRELEALDRPGKRSAVTRGELASALELEAPHRYESVELLPHHPSRPGVYYACGDLPSGDGSALAEFIGLLNPETEADLDLLCAALVTPAAGVEPGARPGILITSDHGVSAGKTATAVAISQVWGGAVRLQPEAEDWSTTLSRLLSDAALSQRLVLVDNLRGKLASAAIESAITERVISGKRMYFGEFSRPNSLTWCLTVNVAELSRDLSDRCVVIKIGPPRPGTDFLGLVTDILQRRRYELVCDVLAFLRAPPRCEIRSRDRFQAWQDAVLSRFPNGEELARLIRERRPAVDADTSEAQDVADLISGMLAARGHCPTCERVHVPTKELAFLVEDLGLRSPRGLAERLKALSQFGPLRHLQPYRRSDFGRGYLWERPGRSERIQPLREGGARRICEHCGDEHGQERPANVHEMWGGAR